MFILPCAFRALFLVERRIFILPCAFHALFLVERGILILLCAITESVMIFPDRQRLVNILDDPYDSYESTATGTLRCTGSVMYDNDLVTHARRASDMHGSTTTREYIRRFVRMDKSALRVDTSRKYWTFLE